MLVLSINYLEEVHHASLAVYITNTAHICLSDA